MEKRKRGFSRRSFVKVSAATAAGFVMAQPDNALGTSAASRLQLGILGVGGRGTFVGNRFSQHPEIEVRALADLRDDKLAAAARRFDVPPESCYRGLYGLDEMLAQDLDVIVVTTPPYFHVRHLEAAVTAGRHIYVEKPLAVDVPGCLRAMAVGEKARDMQLTVTCGLQRRYAEGYRAVREKIVRGDLGDIVSARVQWLGGDLTWARGKGARGLSRREFELRHWYFFRWLSGDMICEQGVHTLDVCNWYLGSHPERCMGYGGRKARVDIGDVNDHYNLVYEYPKERHVSFTSSQFQIGGGDVSEQFFCIEGTALLSEDSGDPPRVTGPRPWIWNGPNGRSHHVTRAVEALVRSVKGTGEYRNDTRFAAESTLTAILGRQTVDKKREMTWEELLRSRETLEPDG
jgi:predicted dehydrogenase